MSSDLSYLFMAGCEFYVKPRGIKLYKILIKSSYGIIGADDQFLKTISRHVPDI